MLWTAKQLKDWDTTTPSMKHNAWIPARCQTRKPGLISRIKTAWHVFTGKYDAVNWEEESYLDYTKSGKDLNKCPVNAQTKENFPHRTL